MEQPQLGLLIAELRKKQGLTQEELVDLCNINVRTIQRIEAGEVNPRSYTIKNILEALGTTIDDVFKEEKQPITSGAPEEAHFENDQNRDATSADNKIFVPGAVSGILYLILHSIIVITVLTRDFADSRLLTNYFFIFLSVFCWLSMALFYGALYTYGKKQVGKLFAYSCIIFIVINAGISVSDVFYYISDPVPDTDSWYYLLIAIPLNFIYGLVFMFLGIGLFAERKNKRELIKWTGIAGMIGGLGFATIILFPVGILGTLVFEILLIALLFMNVSNKKTSGINSRG